MATARWASRPPMVGICLAFDCLRERGLSLDLVFQTLHEAGDDFHLRVCDWRGAAGGTMPQLADCMEAVVTSFYLQKRESGAILTQMVAAESAIVRAEFREEMRAALAAASAGGAAPAAVATDGAKTSRRGKGKGAAAAAAAVPGAAPPAAPAAGTVKKAVVIATPAPPLGGSPADAQAAAAALAAQAKAEAKAAAKTKADADAVAAANAAAGPTHGGGTTGAYSTTEKELGRRAASVFAFGDPASPFEATDAWRVFEHEAAKAIRAGEMSHEPCPKRALRDGHANCTPNAKDDKKSCRRCPRHPHDAELDDPIAKRVRTRCPPATLARLDAG